MSGFHHFHHPIRRLAAAAREQGDAVHFIAGLLAVAK
jgi:hypothetical protein